MVKENARSPLPSPPPSGVAMGSVGSGVAGEQEFAMKSVGTRTTLPRMAPHHLPRRSHSAERVPPPLLPSLIHPMSEGTEVGTEGGSSDGRSSSATSDRPPPTTSMESSSVLTSPPTERAERAERAFREVHRGVLALDLCGNVVAAAASHEKTAQRVRMVTGHQQQSREASKAKAMAGAAAAAAAAMAAANNPKPKLKPKPKAEKTPPKLLPVSGKLEHVREKNSSALVRPSAFKPVVPKSFHSMQNLVGRAGGGDSSNIPQPLRELDSPPGDTDGNGAGGGGQSGMSDSGSNSLSSLPTYSSSGPAALGPLSASTSHLNRLGTSAAPAASTSVGTNTAGGATGDKPAYQNGLGLSASDSGRSSSGKSSSSYPRLCHQVDIPATVRPSPSSDDIIQDLEDRLWEKEQEVLHMRRNLEQSEAAMVQVFEEKQRVWEREMEELRQNYAVRLQQVTRRAQRSQQALQGHVTRLQQDKARLQDEMAALMAQRQELERKCLDYRKEQADILPRLEETKWEVCQKVGEISLLKQQLRESQGEVTQRASEMLSLRGQLKELTAQLKHQEEAILGLKESYNCKSLELKRCEAELQRTLAEVSMLRDKLLVFEAEVLGLRRALGERSHGHGHGHESGGGSLSSGHWASLPCRNPSDGSLMPLSSHPALPLSLPPSEALLSLQSDEAKAQRREAGDLRRQLERLQEELRAERQQRERQALTFAQERHVWHDEKERVLKYQAQLQLSYVETLQKNQALERRVGQLGQRLASSSSSSPCPSPGSPPPTTTTTTTTALTPPTILQPPLLPLSPPPSLPTPEELKLPPSLHQLAPPWPGPSRLERIESTEI
ncbi:leucine zipper putative tumor suppressor 3 [Sardina pilchardus]|uniref:leucine zipper putative tumor suppressor 3 n=1 Tax=Sardina pilchardus TaxID=27697 RepID=UPI002E12FA80